MGGSNHAIMGDAVILESRPALFEILWTDGSRDLFQIKMISSSSSSDEEWRTKGVEFKIIDEGERENKSKESKQETVSIGWIF